MSPAPHHHARLRRGPVDGVHAEELHSGRSFGRHWHDGYGFGVMEAGGHRSASGRGTVEALPGHIVTSNPGEVHDGHPLQRLPRRWRMVHVSAAAMARLVDGEAREFTRPAFDDPRIRTAMASLFARWDEADGEGTATTASACEEALTQVCGLLAVHHSNRRVEMPAPAALDRVCDSLLDQRDAPPNLDQLARLACLSRFQLVRQFARWKGLPPFAWLQQQRLREARRLIATGSPLAEAAVACGFADQSHLHRQFVRHFGFTPGQWRRTMAGALQ
ncbi:helix-turn-helix transcriptional regulator [Hydrogenophaga pseudoflava]|uniref:helix-turn-helix transcriptional regulator n=1 Tax=Hydrogenophaga pseudoflava TaxID=47421 RepID=UPI0027E4666B|nr:AraC family transcriptional regulator [Hydrogenophaga pseudoflava]MDQ7743314.1 AraC family transcriptional regulator [Hydrogenophaga pseudoflava]